MAVRIEDILWDEIMEYSKQNQISKSKITREALRKYLSIYKNPFPMILWGCNEFQFALDCLNENQLEALASVSFENGIKARDFFAKNFLGIKNTSGFKFNVKNIIGLLIYTFTSQGQNWFQKVKTIWRKNNVIIYGSHKLGVNFSFYTKTILKKYMELFKYEIVKEELRKDFIIVEFQKNTQKDDVDTKVKDTLTH